MLIMKMKHSDIKDGSIIVYKGGIYSNLLKGIKSRTILSLTSLIIQMITLSRYVHTASIIEKEGALYLVESHPEQGVVMGKLTNLDIILSQINNNTVDLFQQQDFNKEQFLNRYEEVKNYKYSYGKLFNIGLWNITSIDLIKKNRQKMFCSELTSYLHNIKEYDSFYLISPGCLAHSDLIYKVK